MILRILSLKFLLIKLGQKCAMTWPVARLRGYLSPPDKRRIYNYDYMVNLFHFIVFFPFSVSFFIRLERNHITVNKN